MGLSFSLKERVTKPTNKNKCIILQQMWGRKQTTGAAGKKAAIVDEVARRGLGEKIPLAS